MLRGLNLLLIICQCSVCLLSVCLSFSRSLLALAPHARRKCFCKAALCCTALLPPLKISLIRGSRQLKACMGMQAMQATGGVTPGDFSMMTRILRV